MRRQWRRIQFLKKLLQTFNLSTGQWVVVAYDGDNFPGEITSFDGLADTSKCPAQKWQALEMARSSPIECPMCPTIACAFLYNDVNIFLCLGCILMQYRHVIALISDSYVRHAIFVRQSQYKSLCRKLRTLYLYYFG